MEEKKRYPVTLLCPVTIPLDENFRFDEATFRRLISNAADHGVTCMYTFGTAGEGYAVSTKMFEEITKVFLDEFDAPGARPMTGILGLSVYEMLERIEIAKSHGCKDFQIGTPAWGALSFEEVKTFFHMVCDTYPDCNFMHYNNGPRSKTLVTVPQYIELAGELPNLVAAKYSTMNLFEIRRISTADCPITFYLVDNGYCYGAMIGECGFLSSFATLDYDLAWKTFRAGQEKDLAQLIEMDAFLYEISGALADVEGPKIDAAFDKAIDAVGLGGMSHRLFPPYKGLTDKEFAYAKNIMESVIIKYRTGA